MMHRRGFLNTLLSTAAAAAKARPLAIATFQEDVTPPIGAVLCHGLVEPAKVIVDRLTARGIILFSDEAPIVLCAVDWVGIANDGYDAWRARMSEAAGTTPARVAVHTLHQHDAPAYDPLAAGILRKH
ncbi:MAG: hypothetical protein ABIZ80_07130, partial [Bryobacteraceae bacterium]